jgi:hypothetical protein
MYDDQLPSGAGENRATARRAIRVSRRVLEVVALCSGLALAGTGVTAVAAAQPIVPVPAAVQPACAAAHRGVAACQIAVGAARPAGGAVRAVSGAASPAQAAGSTPVGYTPAQLQAAYALSSQNYGKGTTVAVVAPYDDPDVAGDLAAYRSQFDEPACPQTLSVTAPQCLTELNESGSLITPGSGTAPAANASWALTTSSQLDAISAVCPNCDLLLVEVDSAAMTDVGTGVNIAADAGAQVITIGVAQPETPDELTWDADYLDHPGIEITAAAGNEAAGESGYLTGGVDYPAASQYVTAVGGTSLTPAGTGTCTTATAGSRGWCETVWNDADGVTVSGCSLYEPEPAWQKAGTPAGDTGCGSLRSVADMSADADPATGIAVYDSYEEGDWQAAPVGGTALAAAIVAGAYALAGTPAGDVDPAMYPYQNAGGFTDITSGSNGTCSPAYLCTAGAGYDGPTGLGSPYGVSGFLSSYYQPVTPARILDTRVGTGTDGTVGPVAADGTLALQVEGAGGVPSANVTAVAINLIATGETKGGYIVVYADGSARPGTSNLNYTADTDVANLVIVPVGADGKIDFDNTGSGTTQLVADVFGYFTSDPTAAGDTTYTPITPTRILDTRNGTGAPKAPLADGGTLAVQVGGANGIPSGIAAVAINITAVNETGGGNLIMYAAGTTRPDASNIIFQASTTIAEMAIVPVGTNGKIDIYFYGSGTKSTDVVGDVAGYFTAGTAGEKYHAISPTRVVSSGSVAKDGTLAVTPGSTVVAPDPTLVLNVTEVSATSGYLIAHAAGTGVPATSNLTYVSGRNLADLVLGATGDGTTDLYNNSLDAATLDVDCFGYLSTG